MALATKIKTLILTGILLLTGIHMSAQVVYSCDFENAAENGRWTLNKIANSANLNSWKNIWRIGTPGSYASSTGIYICTHTDTANVSALSNTTDFIVAYRDSICLPSIGTYRISFDWHANGKSSDSLLVYWIPDTYTKNTNSATGVVNLPKALDRYKLFSLRGSPIWKSYSAPFTASTTRGKLLFMWYQAPGLAINPPAAVDNIEICLNTACDVPTNLKYNSSSMLTWSGSADSYEVRYVNTYTMEWAIDSTSATSYILPELDEGTYRFQVRAKCDSGGFSPWVSISQFIWVKGMRCIDFFDFDTAATSVGKCYVGSHDSPYLSLSFSTTPQKVDYGPGIAASMHTLHTEIGEMDPNTTYNGGLRTIPEGEMVSVRLGAYSPFGEDARIEYTYKPNGTADLLDLKYACVLQSGGHGDDNPFFQLDILDQQGNQIDGCTHAYLVAGWNTSTDWHQETDIYWCDWRTITVSLSQYVGQTLTIRLTSSRCVFDTHFGYAYFTLNCRSGSLQSVACGDFSTDHFIAPSGFNYQWYKRSQPNVILGTKSVYNISASDTSIYMVDLISKFNDSCYYTLVANPNPRFPETNVNYTISVMDCQNVVRFSNKSSVVYMNRETYAKTISSESVEDVEWHFDDGSPVLHSTDSVVEHTFPQEGGNFNVMVISSLRGGLCRDTAYIPISLSEPSGKRVEDTIRFCYDGNTPYTFNGKNYTASFVDSTITRIGTDCDSTYVLHVNFVEHVTSELFDTICGEVNNYTYADTIYDKTGDYPVRFTSSLGCDSIVTLHLYKHPMPRITVDSAFAACADETNGLIIPYSLTDIDATVDSIYVIMGDEAVANGFEASYAFKVGDQLQVTWPTNIRPNIYQGRVVFSSPWCTSYSYAFKLELNYPSSMLDKGNGIVVVLNGQANGGYDFVSYQWYRNGEMVDGETASSIRVSDEEDMNAEYYVVVLRGDDNVVLRSCPIIYSGSMLTDTRGEKTTFKVMENGVLYIIRDGIKYTVLGTITEHVH